jgi:hypothetical protein
MQSLRGLAFISQASEPHRRKARYRSHRNAMALHV